MGVLEGMCGCACVIGLHMQITHHVYVDMFGILFLFQPQLVEKIGDNPLMMKVRICVEPKVLMF